MNRKSIYKIVDLFGNEEIHFCDKKRINKNLFDDYDEFVEKFKEKKTTDDCYTPPDVFNIVLNYVNANCYINGLNIVRPFFPGGDYESVNYNGKCVVIDNPPFSIISKVVRFYIEKGVRFFLFAPHLTLFSSDFDCTALVVGSNIVYENGAVVKTSFLSNLFGDAKILGDPELYRLLEAINESNKINLPKYVYPPNIVTVSMVQRIVDQGVFLKILKSDVVHCRRLDSQNKYKKAIFGSGFLMSEKAAAEKAAAEKAAAEKAAAEKEVVITWELSDRERKIIESLKQVS